MPASVIDIEKQALGLTPEQRAHLADKLLSSLSPDPAIEEAWSAEALRRLEEMDNGTVTGVPIEEATARATGFGEDFINTQLPQPLMYA